jgi:CheY-like chemotaxis protein
VSRILIVDDEPDLRYLLRRAFEAAGHQVCEAGDGEAAMRQVRESMPDLIVTDMMMPIMDGVTLIRTLRGDPATAGIPILVASGDPQVACAADAVLPKPYLWREIVQVADTLLADGRAP